MGTEKNYKRGNFYYTFFYFLYMNSKFHYEYAGLFFVQTDHHRNPSPEGFKHPNIYKHILNASHQQDLIDTARALDNTLKKDIVIILQIPALIRQHHNNTDNTLFSPVR